MRLPRMLTALPHTESALTLSQPHNLTTFPPSLLHFSPIFSNICLSVISTYRLTWMNSSSSSLEQASFLSSSPSSFPRSTTQIPISPRIWQPRNPNLRRQPSLKLLKPRYHHRVRSRTLLALLPRWPHHFEVRTLLNLLWSTEQQLKSVSASSIVLNLHGP